MRRRLCALAAVLFCLGGMTGCITRLQDQTEVVSEASSQPELTVSEKFDKLCEQIFQFSLSTNSVTRHYTVADPEQFGLEAIPVSFGSFSMDSETLEKAREFLTELKTFAYDELTEEQRLTYDILLTDFEQSVQIDTYKWYGEALSPQVGLQAQLPSLLAEYTLRSKQDVEDYLTLLKDTERYFAEILAYEQEKSKAGLFMADFTVDAVVEQCESFLLKPDENMLIVSFPSRLESVGLTEEEKQAFIAQNTEVVKGPFLNAYRSLVEGLKALKGTGKNTQGLCGLEKGKAYYAHIVAADTGSSRSIEDMRSMMQTELDKRFAVLTNATQEEVMAWQLYKPSLTDPEAMLRDMQRKLQMDFPEAPEASYTLKKVDPALEDFVSPAFYLIPPIDDFQNNVIYINDKYNEGQDLYPTLVHEGYPGHLYQTVYFLSRNPAPVRSVLNYAGFDEGWATYVEYEYGYAYSGRPEAAVKIDTAGALSGLLINALVDIGIHYDGWDVGKTLAFLKQYYGDTFDREGAQAYFESVAGEPGNALPYAVGYLEFMELRNQAENRLGEGFDVKEFHRVILETGPVPFSVLQKQVEIWVNGQQVEGDSPAAAA